MSRNELTHRASSKAPFLARFAVARLVGETLPGGYDSGESVWTVDSPEGRVPLIAHHTDLAELLTKTKVAQETDDSDVSLEFATKEDGDQDERDDRATLAVAALELTTKTHAQLESDDTDPTANGLW